MSQEIFDVIDSSISGEDLAVVLNDFKNAVASGFSGTSRPTNLEPGGYWVDTSNSPDTWSYKLYTGTDDVEVFVIDLATGSSSISLAVDNFVVRRVSADTVGAVLDLVKRRIASNGQVKSGDVVGEMRFTGRDNAGNNPVVAKIIYTAAEDMTAGAFGGSLAFYSTPQGQSALVKHMEFIGGIIDAITPLKLNALIYAEQSLASGGTQSSLSTAKPVTVITGASSTAITGIDSTGLSKFVVIHNKSSDFVYIQNQVGGVTAANRIALAGVGSITISQNESISLYYDTTSSRWKVVSMGTKFNAPQKFTTVAKSFSWATPSYATLVRLFTKKIVPKTSASFGSSFVQKDVYGRILSVGSNYAGQLGDATLTASKSSPVAVVGGLKFKEVFASSSRYSAILEDGTLYTWGDNYTGQLGDGTFAAKSSPVAVVGGRKFVKVDANPYDTTYAMIDDGSIFAWGKNNYGQLGDGTVIPKSSPVAVLGGRKFDSMSATERESIIAITKDGDAYAWGNNTNGMLGLGDTVSRSSPVAVLGGLKFSKIVANNNNAYGITTTGALYAWGLNTYGQLGDGTTLLKRSPTLVVGITDVADVFTDRDAGGTVYATTKSGNLYGWGENTSGQLGVGDISRRSSPVLILSGNIKQVETRSNYIKVIDISGNMYSWGGNIFGQLGLGDTNARSTPTLVMPGTTFSRCEKWECAIGTDGSVYRWGANDYGQVGDGTFTTSFAYVTSPVKITTLSAEVAEGQNAIDIPITGGNTYDITTGRGPCYFGSIPIGYDLESVVVEYL